MNTGAGRGVHRGVALAVMCLAAFTSGESFVARSCSRWDAEPSASHRTHN
jgi:hypothetical protein